MKKKRLPPRRFIEDDFDLDEYKKKILIQKKVLFWERNRKNLSIISVISTIVLFFLGYFLFNFIIYLISTYTLMR